MNRRSERIQQRDSNPPARVTPAARTHARPAAERAIWIALAFNRL
jgi:hypothetical protein